RGLIDSRAGISARIVALRIDPKIASPNDPPSERKNMIVAVATPRSWNSTAFCVAIDVDVNTDATAKPMATIGRSSQTYEVEPSMRLMAKRPRAPTIEPTTGNAL